ncbi:succinate dehydrogenase/fumarate reductase flavoprotein subunit, partial [Bordetella petrii]|nr:succinate dehydrogenase/fumarate reductase flavoprotein subunit [Bordetella petrii]
RAPLGRPGGDLHALRERLSSVMWDDAGIVRDAAGLNRALDALGGLRADLEALGVAHGTLAYNMAWHDWLNLDSLIHVSEAIVRAALAREDSRGAHFRTDHPDVRDLEHSWFSVVTQAETTMQVSRQPVRFTRVRPGQTLLTQEAA